MTVFCPFVSCVAANSFLGSNYLALTQSWRQCAINIQSWNAVTSVLVSWTHTCCPALSVVRAMSSSTSVQYRSVPPGLNYAAGSWEGFLLLVRTERPGELHNARPTPAVKLLFCCKCARLEERGGRAGGLTWPGKLELSPGRAASLMWCRNSWVFGIFTNIPEF